MRIDISVLHYASFISSGLLQMKVHQLIAILQNVPDFDLDVGYLWDGEVRSTVDEVWVNKAQDTLVLSHSRGKMEHEPYTKKDRPLDAKHHWVG